MKHNGVDVVEQEGYVIVLVSRKSGAGWSTWNHEALAYDKRVIDLFDKNPPPLNKKQLDVVEKSLAILGYDGVYMGGYNNIEKELVRVGERFIITEHYGEEKVCRVNDLDMFTYD